MIKILVDRLVYTGHEMPVLSLFFTFLSLKVAVVMVFFSRNSFDWINDMYSLDENGVGEKLCTNRKRKRFIYSNITSPEYNRTRKKLCDNDEGL